MGVATPWPKKAMPPPPIIWKKNFFSHFLAYFMYWVAIYLLFIKQPMPLPITVINLFFVETKKWLGLKLIY